MALNSSIKMFNLTNIKVHIKSILRSHFSATELATIKKLDNTLKVRLWGNRHIYTLLIIIQYDKTLGGNLTRCNKVKNISTFWFKRFTCRNLP